MVFILRSLDWGWHYHIKYVSALFKCYIFFFETSLYLHLRKFVKIIFFISDLVNLPSNSAEGINVKLNDSKMTCPSKIPNLMVANIYCFTLCKKLVQTRAAIQIIVKVKCGLCCEWQYDILTYLPGYLPLDLPLSSQFPVLPWWLIPASHICKCRQ